MSQSLLLPAFIALFGVVAAMFLLGFGKQNLDAPDAREHRDAPTPAYAVEYGGDQSFVDDDEYVEYTVAWDEPEHRATRAPNRSQADATTRVDTEPMPAGRGAPSRSCTAAARLNRHGGAARA